LAGAKEKIMEIFSLMLIAALVGCGAIIVAQYEGVAVKAMSIAAVPIVGLLHIWVFYPEVMGALLS
jgi:hypothetical protein